MESAGVLLNKLSIVVTDQGERRRSHQQQEVLDSALLNASMILSAIPRTAPWLADGYQLLAVDTSELQSLSVSAKL